MSEQDDFASELRGDDEDEQLNAKGNDWVASIVGGLIVGVVVSVSDRWLSKDNDNNDTLVEVKTRVEYLGQQVNKLAEQPYVRRDEFNAGIETIENRVTGLERQVDQLQQRSGSNRR